MPFCSPEAVLQSAGATGGHAQSILSVMLPVRVLRSDLVISCAINNMCLSTSSWSVGLHYLYWACFPRVLSSLCPDAELALL